MKDKAAELMEKEDYLKEYDRLLNDTEINIEAFEQILVSVHGPTDSVQRTTDTGQQTTDVFPNTVPYRIVLYLYVVPQHGRITLMLPMHTR